MFKDNVLDHNFHTISRSQLPYLKNGSLKVAIQLLDAFFIFFSLMNIFNFFLQEPIILAERQLISAQCEVS